jgi:hypothetical protein
MLSAQIEDHEKDVVGCALGASLMRQMTCADRQDTMVNRRA